MKPKDQSLLCAASLDTVFLQWGRRFRSLIVLICLIPGLPLCQIFVRAFDADERLVGVAFVDVGVYVTSLRALKESSVGG
jgi:hypothetical protein